MDTPERPTPKVEVRVFPTWFLVFFLLGWLWLVAGAYQLLDVKAAMEYRTLPPPDPRSDR